MGSKKRGVMKPVRLKGKRHSWAIIDAEGYLLLDSWDTEPDRDLLFNTRKSAVRRLLEGERVIKVEIRAVPKARRSKRAKEQKP